MGLVVETGSAELFVSASVARATACIDSITRTLRSTLAGERSLLDALDKADAPVRSSCRSGNCGACLAYLETGEVGYTKEVTFPLEAGEVLMCSCVPLSAIRIRLPDKPVGARRRTK